MKHKPNLLSDAVRFGLLVAAGFASANAFAQQEDDAGSMLDRIEVTGSRIKRADVEGALPVQVITRAELDSSGKVSVADFMRDVTFNSAGSFRPRSGSSAQAFAEIDLRGLGSNRTLVLIDGRRAPKAPYVGSASDLNAVPMAAVERIEILTDGASAIYGSDAIGGVVNIILRKDFNGAEVVYGRGDTSITGGDTEEGAITFGASSDRGQIIAGIAYNKRGMVFTRDRPWGQTLGNSVYGNNFYNPGALGEEGWSGDIYLPVQGGCNDPDFSIHPDNGRCVYNFNAVAADEAKLGNQSLFARGSYQINDDWSAYLSTSIARVESFGRYAPTPGLVFIPADSPNNPTANDPNNPNPGVAVDTYLLHRFAAAGNRDTTTESNVYDFNFGFKGRVFDRVDVDFGIRQSQYKYFELGRNYIVGSLAEQAIQDGSYDIFNPSANPREVLDGIKATINRESGWTTQEIYALGNMDLFDMGDGVAGLAFGAEYRTDEYSDQYDSLQEAGVILGSSGNSAGGKRDISAVYFEMLLPVLSQLEVSVAGRYENYSDYGSDFAPKVSLRYQPFDNLTFRASYGEGFAAPTLNVITQKTAFSADTVFDPATCVSFGDYPNEAGRGGLTPAQWCAANGGVNGVQVDAYRNASPDLGSEQSKQYSVGIAWDATEWLNATVDYYNIEIDDRIKFFSSQELVDIDNGDDPSPFPGAPCSLSRASDGSISRVDNCYFNQGTVETRGVDVRFSTQFDFGDWGALRNQLGLSYVDSYRIDGGEEQTGLEGFPDLRANLQNTWSYGDFEANWTIRYIDDNGPIPSQSLNDLQVSWNAPWKAKISLGATNIEDELPYLGTGASFGGRNFNFSLYDAYGRTTYLRYQQSF